MTELREGVDALVVGLAAGIIPAEATFDGFKNDVTITLLSMATKNVGALFWPLQA